MDFLPFSRILGQERALGFLKKVMDRDRIPHAYLFVGIPGVGKTSTALAFTQAVNCIEPVDGEGCGQCISCRQIAGGNFPDLLFEEPEGQSLKIDQIRKINHALAFKPLSGKFRVSIIRKAELMTAEAANAFLKTLEEPPLGNILILNVTEPLDLLPTIVSRCQKVSFLPLPVDIIGQEVVDRAGIDRDKATVLARLSEGSLGKALKMCETDFFERREIYLSHLIEMQGLPREDVLSLAVDYAKQHKNKDLDPSEKGEGVLFDLLSIWKSWFRDLLLLNLGGPRNLLINVDFSHKLQNLYKNFKVDPLIGSIRVLDQAQRDLLRMRNVDLNMETTFLTLKRYAGQMVGA
ncbi:MAG: DNA polymerase III subunit delta' [Pseudomonadota bacterium]